MKRPEVAGVFVAVVALAIGCRSSNDVAPDASASPQASAEPAPLAATPLTAASAAAAALEGGLSPSPLRNDEHLSADSYGRDASGYALSASFRPTEVPVPPHAPEVNLAGIDAARRKTEPRMALDLTTTRMRIVLSGSGFVLPPEAEIRARSDRYGHVVVWPGAASYRPLSPGAMRALLGERRFDVAPLGAAEVMFLPDSGKRIGIKTHRVEVETRAAKAVFELGRLDGLGEGGVLVCRLLLDLMGASPHSPVCATDELPMRAELRWTGHGALGFEVTGVLRKTDMAQAPLLVPPAGASFAAAPMPTGGTHVMLTKEELAAFRSGPIDVPSVPTGDGLFVQNTTLQMRLLLVDGVPIAWAAPGARDLLLGLPRGRYVMQWRTFLGETVEPPQTLAVPGVAQVGGADGGGAL